MSTCTLGGGGGATRCEEVILQPATIKSLRVGVCVLEDIYRKPLASDDVLFLFARFC